MYGTWRIVTICTLEILRKTMKRENFPIRRNNEYLSKFIREAPRKPWKPNGIREDFLCSYGRHHNKSSERSIRSHSKKQSQTSRATRFTAQSHEKAPQTLINDNPSYFAQYAIKRDFFSPFEVSWCGHYSNDLIPI